MEQENIHHLKRTFQKHGYKYVEVQKKDKLQNNQINNKKEFKIPNNFNELNKMLSKNEQKKQIIEEINEEIIDVKYDIEN